ncbi:50S ribosomal protein L5 [candidate division KSB1 bacterium]|nr:MAG: 50S ribosomal protein L5 [candidate division KSB1 bacterium]
MKDKYIPRLKIRYLKEIIPYMMKTFNYGNVMEVPRLTKISVNMGVGEAISNPKSLESASTDLSIITGRKPMITRARKSISNFKLRKGNPIGCFVTLRGDYMYEFLDRLISVAIPRIRDFRGLSDKSFDGHGNYNMGIKEHIIFPEIDYDKVEKIRGMDIAIVTTAKTDMESLELLKRFGMPFKVR